jgi:methionyl-tRNA formyltransferase
MMTIVAFNVLPPAFRLVSDWIEQAGQQLALLVTTPGASRRRTPTYREVIAMTPPEVDVFVTTHLRAATRVVQAVEPDLIVSFTFPYRLPPELLQIPRLGAVNLHPTPLPAYRGPNPARLAYDGWPTIGATLHWKRGVRHGPHSQPAHGAPARGRDTGLAADGVAASHGASPGGGGGARDRRRSGRPTGSSASELCRAVHRGGSDG